MPELPTCACISGFPPYDRLTFIYQAAAELSGDDTLPSADCVAGVPAFHRFAYIYAAFRVIAGDDSLPSQECVEGEPYADQVARIYQAARIYAGDSSLPTYECVRGLPLWSIWVEIYRALYSAAGSPEELEDPLCVNIRGLDVLSQVFCSLTYLIENANPEVLAATVSEVTGNIEITFNQNVSGQLGFSITINGNPFNLDYDSGEGTNLYSYIIDGANVAEGDVVLLDYTPGNITSVATGNPLEAFVDFPVINPFDVFTYFRPGGVDTYFRPDGTSIYIRP